ncbi:MAG: T9SS type A sorting domain-containing protein [Ignavibacteria bacterium]|nr:T9SS type A sorting domain-containing protein [Ignavibacteria bacterium]
MKKMMLLCSLFVLLQVSAFGQAYMPYVDEVRGDTLVIKDYYDMGEVPNSLYDAINADSIDVPAGRVYLLKNYGWYPVTSNPVSKQGVKMIIMGEINESLKKSQNADGPAVFSGYVGESTNSIGNLNSGGDLLVKNIIANAGNPAGELGWTLFGSSANAKLTVENCILEHNQWVMINPSANSKITFKDNYIVNLVGHPCRRNGGVIDFFSNLDSIVFENNTVVNAQGSIIKYRSGYQVNRSIINHNTFVNCAGYIMMNIGNTGNISLTNNLFVNSNVQGYCSVFQTEDAGEVDAEDLPMGFVNVIVDSASAVNGYTFYANHNATYWSPIWDDYISTLSTGNINGTSDWYSQRIKMNSRSETMFADDATYPYLTNGTWIEGIQPNFTDPADLYTTQLDLVKAYALSCVNTASSESLPNWRLVSTPVEDLFVFADFPVPVDLSYDNAELLTGANSGLPVGDLNWFPAEYASWLTIKAQENANAHTALYTGVIPQDPTDVEALEMPASSYRLDQNYPNPFNPSTTITFAVPEAGNVTLKVYDVIGKEVASLVNGQLAADTYKVSFDAASLSSGVYLYTLSVGNFTQTKKMVLMK